MKSKDKNNFKISLQKAEAREIVKKKGVRKNLIALNFMFAPLLISSIVLTLLTSIIPVTFVLTIFMIIQLICYSTFTYASAKIINNGDGKPKFEFHSQLFSVFIFIDLVLSLISMFVGGSLFGVLLSFVLSILFMIVCIPIIFLSALRNYPMLLAIQKGFILGNEYFWPLLKMVISFIPLFILISITFGIVFIFKGTYIVTSFGILCRDIFQKENLA